MMEIRLARQEDALLISQLIQTNVEQVVKPYISSKEFDIWMDAYSQGAVKEQIQRFYVFMLSEGEKLFTTASLQGDLLAGFYTDANSVGKGYGAQLIQYIIDLRADYRLRS